eukprot:1920432-Pyramimonas_sp.AAC.1
MFSGDGYYPSCDPTPAMTPTIEGTRLSSPSPLEASDEKEYAGPLASWAVPGIVWRCPSDGGRGPGV